MIVGTARASASGANWRPCAFKDRRTRAEGAPQRESKMKSCFSFLIAAAVGITGAAATFSPAQAALTRSVPAIAAANTSDGIVQVHRRRYHHHHRPVIVRRYYQPYVYPYPYAYYRPYYYPHYYRRPAISFQFSFGGGHR